MTDQNFFLSFYPDFHNILSYRFELMNGVIHQLFLSFSPVDLVIEVSIDIPYEYHDGVLSLDLRERNGNYSFSISFSSSSSFNETYIVITKEKIDMKELYGKYQSGKNILSLSENHKGSLYYYSFFRKKTFYFDILSFDSIKYELLVSPVLEDENRKYYLSLLYQEIDVAFLLMLIQEDYFVEESSERTLIKNQTFIRLKEE